MVAIQEVLVAMETQLEALVAVDRVPGNKEADWHLVHL